MSVTVREGPFRTLIINSPVSGTTQLKFLIVLYQLKFFSISDITSRLISRPFSMAYIFACICALCNIFTSSLLIQEKAVR